MIVRIQVSKEVALSMVCWWYLFDKPVIKNYDEFCYVVKQCIENHGNGIIRQVIDPEKYNRALAVVNKYYYKTKGGKKMSDTTVQSPEEPKVTGGETADQEAKETPVTDEKTMPDSSETKPIND